MIFNEVTLQNFGIYGGIHSVPLRTNPQKPIILIGGLNGGGKTTFLDAIQLALYGKSANCSNRGSMAYDQYLFKCIHRHIAADELTSVEVVFEHVTAGLTNQYKVTRSWSNDASPIRERIQVVLNGAVDKRLAENWSEHIEGLIPNGISSLFFFDGEKIEQLADPKNAQAIIHTGINSLLGLELVDRLLTDLSVLEKKQVTGGKSGESGEKLVKAQTDLDRLADLHEKSLTEVAQLRQKHSFLEKEVAATEDEFIKKGGQLAQDRPRLLELQAFLRKELGKEETALKELLAGAGPFLLISDILKEAELQAERELKSQENTALIKTLAQRDQRILSKLNKSTPPNVIKQLKTLLAKDRSEREQLSKTNVLLGIDASGLDSLKELRRHILPTIRKDWDKVCERLQETKDHLSSTEQQLSIVPSDQALALIVTDLKDKRSEMGKIDARLQQEEAKCSQLNNELQRQTAILKNLREKILRSEWENEDRDRTLVYSSKVRLTLSAFKQRVLLKHIERIQRLVLDSYQQLLRKKSLIKDIQIDPATLGLTLINHSHQIIPPERLSAGERQLLAVGLVWGLARASGRPLPTIIDTPLGRLDSHHRDNLVKRYFPYASHQVILLSTDKEIAQGHLEDLKSKIAYSYLVRFDEDKQSSIIEKGYFEHSNESST